MYNTNETAALVFFPRFELADDSVAYESTSHCTEISPDKLHEAACEAHRIGNRGRLTLCTVLHVLKETRGYHKLGYSSVESYADEHFDLRRTETFHCIRVATALERLAMLREAFVAGRLGWWALKQITRVATEETQERWLEFARANTTRQLEAEVADAVRSGRDAPSGRRYGLPNLDQKLTVWLSRSNMEKLLKVLGSMADEVGPLTGAEEVTTEQALMALVESRLGEMENESSTGRTQFTRVNYALVYQTCPSCDKARVQTRDGFVEVDAEEIDRIAGDADVISLDEEIPEHNYGPTPPKMRKKILLREGMRCGNPRCLRTAEH